MKTIKPPKPVHFYLPIYIYPTTVIVSFDEVPSVLFRKLNKRYYGLNDWDKDIIMKGLEDSQARCTILSNGVILLRFSILHYTKKAYLPKFKLLGCIVHETLHATAHILNHVGIKYDIDTNEEAYTYLQEYMFEQICLKLNLVK